MKRWIALTAVMMIALALQGMTASGPVLVIPAAAHSDGSRGSHWQTDLMIYNPGPVGLDGAGDVYITLELIPMGVQGSATERVFVELPESLNPGATRTIHDVLGTYFPGYGIGALVIFACDSDGLDMPITASSRTWTPEREPDNPQLPGTYGQGIPGIPWDYGYSTGVRSDIPDTLYITGIQQTPEYRTNLGLVNLSLNLRTTLRVEIWDSQGNIAGSLHYTLDPWSHLQIHRILALMQLDGPDYTARITVTETEDLNLFPDASHAPSFTAYGSCVNMITNDPVYLEAYAPLDPGDLWEGFLIPTASHAAGRNDSFWRTDITIHNPHPTEETYIILELVPTGPSGSAGNIPWQIVFDPVLPGATVTLTDVMGTWFPDHPLGALVVRGIDDAFNPFEIVVTSRTWTPERDPDDPENPGSIGQGIPGIPGMPTSRPLVITGLEVSEAFRTNLGLVNASVNCRQELKISLYNADGLYIDQVGQVLEPWAHIQIDNILGALRLQGTDYTAVVELIEYENLFNNIGESWDPSFFAYGLRVDEITNDPFYLPAVPIVTDGLIDPDLWYDFDDAHPWLLCPDEEFPHEATVVRAFDRVDHYFLGDDNRRDVYRDVQFPEPADWVQVGLRIHLECPENGLCDHWDRTANIQLVLNPEDDPSEWQFVELARYITPYRIEMCAYMDVTPFANLLSGSRKLLSSVDTWIGPGSVYGDGWRVTADFVFYPGPAGTADDIITVYNEKTITVGFVEGDNTVDAQTQPVTIQIPPDALRVEMALVGTGHSYGNTLNCAEFCVMRQNVLINGTFNSVIPWRNDCDRNPTSPQYGTWIYDRNGWCPGAAVLEHRLDVTEQMNLGGDNIIDLDIRLMDGTVYDNTDPVDWHPLMLTTLRFYIYK